MNQKVSFPTNSLPLKPELLEAVKHFDSKELYWLSGYCSGIADARESVTTNQNTTSVQNSATVELRTAVLYASQTGNAQGIAESLQQNLQQKGLKSTLNSFADFKTNQLKELDVVVIVASTHGEGEPPDDAIEFHEFIQGKRAPKLTGVKHAVLSLGDSSYEFFCQTGKDFDLAFTKLGSQQLVERVDCDLDYETSANSWIDDVVTQLAELSNASSPNVATLDSNQVAASSLVHNKENPFTATILQNQKITGQGSVKHINHIELSIEGSGLSYQPGDSLGVWAKNNAQVVAEILSLTNIDIEQVVSFKQQQKNIVTVLTENLEISLINKEFIGEYAALAQSPKLLEIQGESFSEFVKNNQIVDVINLAPITLTAQQLVDLLKPIKPRMYSIASSLAANPEEVHLTVALSQSQSDFAVRYGTASHFLIEQLQEDDQVLVFVEHNRHFKLPADDAPVIMIGPGTGIAPFRAFLQEREQQAATGENWLYFGNPNFNTDFLYQIELQKQLKLGVLNQLSVAFSRDQQQKIYVQDRILENAAELWDWIEKKQAYVYVCGDMNRMAKDVQAALLQVIREQGSKTSEQAEDYLKVLKKDKRYQRDVY